MRLHAACFAGSIGAVTVSDDGDIKLYRTYSLHEDCPNGVLTPQQAVKERLLSRARPLKGGVSGGARIALEMALKEAMA